LDGQQRLQTLYALFRGAILDPQGRALEAHVDITQGGDVIDGTDLLYRLEFSHESVVVLPRYRIRNLMECDAQKDAASIAYDLNDALAGILNEDAEARRKRERQVHTNISQLRALLREEQHFWVEELDGVANKYEYRKILDIFVRVNSGGTKLTASDLMFAALKEGWEDIEENTEQTVDMLNLDGRLQFEASFPLKCLLVANGEGAEVNEVAKFTAARGEALLSRIKTTWDRAEAAFQELRDFIQHDLRLFSDKIIRTYNAFVPLFDYLYHNPKPLEGSRARMRAYYYKAQLFNWFGSSGDATINSVHQIVGQQCAGGFPLNEVVEYFRRRSYAVEIRDEHLSDNRVRSILLSIVYVDRWGTSPFDVRFKGNEPQVDHIYPQSMLRTRLGQLSAQINDIGNLRYVGATDDNRKRAELPADYCKRLTNPCRMRRVLSSLPVPQGREVLPVLFRRLFVSGNHLEIRTAVYAGSSCFNVAERRVGESLSGNLPASNQGATIWARLQNRGTARCRRPDLIRTISRFRQRLSAEVEPSFDQPNPGRESDAGR
jgi:hypothetical protein